MTNYFKIRKKFTGTESWQLKLSIAKSKEHLLSAKKVNHQVRKHAIRTSGFKNKTWEALRVANCLLMK